MSERPAWHLDVETAKRECQVCFDKWQSQMHRLGELVAHHETYTPEAFEASLEEIMPEFQRTTLASVSRLQIMAQIKGGEMRYHEDEAEQGGTGE
ncbi:MAG TPA: hypothetical protein VEJ46_00915 [Candidatus Acidoferrum sp.]|nr:hypothetical protein [Candidatus Acidoferrum sp.]